MLAALVPRVPAVGPALADLDQRVVERIAEQRRDDRVTQVFTLFGDLADTFTILGLIAGAGVVLALARRWRSLAVLAVAVPVEMAVFVTVATLSGRARPASAFEPVAVAGSYPSGHAGMAVVVYGGIAIVVRHMTSDVVARRTAVVLATLIALLVGLGRLWLTMHHPTDIVAGWLEGAACLAVGVIASRYVADGRSVGRST